MAGSGFFGSTWTDQVRLPVKWVDGEWEFLYGGSVPVRDGALGELTISVHQIADEQFRDRVARTLTVRILEEDTALLVALSDPNTKGAMVGDLPPDVKIHDLPAGVTRMVRIKLGPLGSKGEQADLLEEFKTGGLWLKLTGLNRTELLGSTVLMPVSERLIGSLAACGRSGCCNLEGRKLTTVCAAARTLATTITCARVGPKGKWRRPHRRSGRSHMAVGRFCDGRDRGRDDCPRGA